MDEPDDSVTNPSKHDSKNAGMENIELLSICELEGRSDVAANLWELT